MDVAHSSLELKSPVNLLDLERWINHRLERAAGVSLTAAGAPDLQDLEAEEVGFYPLCVQLDDRFDADLELAIDEFLFVALREDLGPRAGESLCRTEPIVVLR